MIFRLFLFCFLSVFSFVHAEQSITDTEFQELINELRHQSIRTYGKIARSGHPQALKVLNALDALKEEGRDCTFAKFEELSGYTVDGPSDVQFSIRSADLEIARAMAGDDAAIQSIVDEYEGYVPEVNDGRRSAFNKMKMVGGDRAVRFFGTKLYETTRLWEFSDTVGGPTDISAAMELEQLIELPQDSGLRFKNVPTPQNEVEYFEWPEKRRKAWRTWWAENAHKYGATSEEIAFAKQAIDDGASVAVPVVVEVAQVIKSKDRKPAEAHKIDRESPEQSSQWWLWLVGALVVVGGLGLVLRRKS